MVIQKSGFGRLGDPKHVTNTPTTSLQLELFLKTHQQLKAHAQVPDAITTNRLATRKQKATVICGFAAIGKSTFKNACQGEYEGVPVMDLDSSLFPKGPAWPHNYLKAIRERLDETCILMISTHKDIYSQLLEEDFNLVLVYPKRELKAEWLERIRRREEAAGSNAAASICGVVSDHWGGWIDEYGQQTCPRYEMSGGEYLQDAVDEVLYCFQRGLCSSKVNCHDRAEE